jgi:TrmH family RNA methyltransferase
VISSVANPRIKRVRRLRKRSHREAQGLVLVEGHRAVNPALDAGAVLELLYASASAEAPAVQRVRAAGIDATEVSAEVMAYLTAAASAPGVLAVARMPQGTAHGARGVLLDRVRDPGVEGALISLAAATGAETAVILPGCADPFDPKVMRAAGGAHFAVRVVRDAGPVEAAIARGRAAGASVLALVPEGPAPWDLELPSDLVLLVNGDEHADQGSDGKIAVPDLAGRASLALRAAAVLYEWTRQMRHPT